MTATVAPPASAAAGGGRLPRLLYVIGTYPSLTTTFIDREIALLRRWGVPLDLVSIRRPSSQLAPEQRALQAGIRYVLPARAWSVLASHARLASRRPLTYVRTLAHLLTGEHPSLRARLRTVLHFGMGVHVARLVERGHRVDHVHAHFVDRATTVAMVVGRLLDLPYSATAHANDIYVDPVLLPEKLAGASFIATCTGYNAAHLASIDGRGKVVCLHHGLDPDSYRPPPDDDGVDTPVLLSVAQLREKKGLHDLVEACAQLRSRGYELTCDIVGDGPLRGALQERIDRRRLGDVVRLVGARPHPDVVERYRRASVFVLPCVTAPDGDRDGIPNAILEAMAMALPVVSTRHSGIPEAVVDGATGILVDPHDPTALADAIARLLDDPATGRRLGRRGREVVRESFDIRTNAALLVQRFTGVEVRHG